jgi:hypothetical protein
VPATPAKPNNEIPPFNRKTQRKQFLKPVERMLEVLCGVIMVLTFTCSFSVASAAHTEVRNLLIAALGCNVAWGIIDAAFYLMGNFAGRGQGILALRAVGSAASPKEAHGVIVDALPPLLASALTPADFETIRQRLSQLPEPAKHPWLTKDDWIAALGVFLLEFLVVLPLAIPFVFIHDAKLALRVSNGIAIALLFVTGYRLGRHAGYHPWRMGISMVLIGLALIGVAIALGG